MVSPGTMKRGTLAPTVGQLGLFVDEFLALLRPRFSVFAGHAGHG